MDLAHLAQWLAQNPELTRPPGARAEARNELPVWVEKPDHECCYCCGGTGLVRTEAARRFINADYDPTMSPPILCLRSPACGAQKQTFTDPELGPRQTVVRRYENITGVPVIPQAIADEVHRVMKDEARAMALDPDREQTRRMQMDLIREHLDDLNKRWRMPE